MAGKNRLIFTIEGPAQYNHHLELAVFVEKTKQFHKLLKKSAKENGVTGDVFHIINLSHSSPATMECEPMGENISSAVTAFDSVTNNLNLVEEEKPDKLSHEILSGMEELARYDSKKIALMEIQTIEEDKDKKIYKLDDRFREIIAKARDAEEKVVSTLDGKLEEINIHGGTKSFKIYSSLPHRSPVTCKFPDNFLGTVQSALGCFVSVSGECFYRPGEAVPYKIHIRDMEVLPPGEELPSLSDLRGIAPEATGGKSSEQFVRESRDKWHKEI